MPFDGKRSPKQVAAHREPDRLFSEIGKLKMELDWLKEIRDQPAEIRQGLIAEGCTEAHLFRDAPQESSPPQTQQQQPDQ